MLSDSLILFQKYAAKKNIKLNAQIENHVLIKADRKVHKIPQGEILFIESLDVFVRIHLKDRILISRENITSLESKLDSSGFVRIHRSYIVGTKWVLSISSEGVEVNGKILPFGRAFKLGALSNLGVSQGPSRNSIENYEK